MLRKGRGRKDDALGWFSLALGDLAAARSQSDAHVRPRIAAFHANRAAGKALKAALALSGIDPPLTGDLDELRRILPAGLRMSLMQKDLAPLSRYGPDISYPGDEAPISPIESVEAVRQATAVIRLIGDLFDRRGVSTAGLTLR